MTYMINVDLETGNSTADLTCGSALHEPLGRHFDMTIHAMGCFVRGKRAVSGRPTRFWDDNGGVGYSLPEVIARVVAWRAQYPTAHPRRCSRCDVLSHLPDWD